MQNLFDPGGKREQLKQSLAQELYTVEEAAQAMRFTEDRVRRLVKKGELAHVRPSKRSIRISKEAIIDYLAPSPIKKYFR